LCDSADKMWTKTCDIYNEQFPPSPPQTPLISASHKCSRVTESVTLILHLSTWDNIWNYSQIKTLILYILLLYRLLNGKYSMQGSKNPGQAKKCMQSPCASSFVPIPFLREIRSLSLLSHKTKSSTNNNTHCKQINNQLPKTNMSNSSSAASFARKVKNGLKKAVDATILSPYGGYVDGSPRLNGALAKDTARTTKEYAQADRVK